jgi:hypothetical protein
VKYKREVARLLWKNNAKLCSALSPSQLISTEQEEFMTPDRGRDYKVTDKDFPITVGIEAKNLPDNQAFVADTQISINGTIQGQQKVTVIQSGALKNYQIERPKQNPCELVSAIDAYFPDSADDTAKYQIRITSMAGDIGKTTVSRPSGPVSHVGLVFRRSEQ